MGKLVSWDLENKQTNEKDAKEVTKILVKLDEYGKEYIAKVVADKIPKGLILIALTRMLINFIKASFKPSLLQEVLDLTIISLRKEFEDKK